MYTAVILISGGYTLPKGTWIVPNLWAIQHCASNWPDPDQFLPERHIQEDGTLAKSDRSVQTLHRCGRICLISIATPK